MKLEFYGAAGCVTGSCHVLEVNGRKVLLDCGLIQGSRKDEAGNSDPFPFDAGAVSAVVLSHAHIDHSGRLPLLVKRGFGGHIHMQNATRALCSILLTDAAGLEAGRVRRENRQLEEKGKRLLEPLYEQSHVDQVIGQSVGHPYDRVFDVVPGVRVCYRDAGHIMGSTVVSVEITEGSRKCTLVFSGDLGQFDSPILRDPQSPPAADLVLMESTYGDRLHRDRAASLVELGEVLETAWAQGGNVLIPAFAVGRSQEMLYQLGKHYDSWQIDRWQIFLDSPLAIEASQVYWEYEHLFDEEAGDVLRIDSGMPALPNLHLTRTAAESRVINRLSGGAIIIAGSGMCNGGRILHHMKQNLGRREAHLVFTGYQPPGTLGRRIIDGAESARIHGETYPIRAQVHTIGGMSAHGDQGHLLRWYEGIPGRPQVFLVHGDPDAARVLQSKLEALGADARAAAPGMTVDLGASAKAPG
ncbi:MAG: MBL fold metallo-hydrolase [Pseudomonadales bacterium]